MPTVKQILSGSIHVPTGLHFYELAGRIHFHVNKSVLKFGDTKKILTFLDTISEPIRKHDLQLLGVQEGIYLVSTHITNKDKLFAGSIIRIDRYNPFFNIIYGACILQNHSTNFFCPRWSPLQLSQEIKHGFWEVVHREDIERIAQQRNIQLIQHF